MGAGSSAAGGNRGADAVKALPAGPRKLRVVSHTKKALPASFGSVVVPSLIPAVLPPPPVENSGSYAWFVEDLDHPGEWEAYDRDACCRLDAALQSGKDECFVVVKKRACTVDLNAMQQRGTGGMARPRSVKRVAVEADGVVMREKRYVPVDPFTDEVIGSALGDDGAKRDVGGESRDGGRRVDGPMFPRLLRSVTAHAQPPYVVSFAPDGSTLLTGSRSELLHWDVKRAQVVTDFSVHSGLVLTATYSPNGSRVVYGGDDSNIRLYDTTAPDMRAEFTGHARKVYGVAFLACEGRFASISMDRTLRCWDVETSDCVCTSECHIAPVFALEASRQSDWLVITAGDDNTACMHDLRLASGATVTARFLGHTNTIWSCSLRGDETQFVTAGIDTALLVWDVRRPTEPLLKVFHHLKPVHCVQYMPYNRGILSCARDSSMRLTDALSGGPVWRANAHVGNVFRVCYHAGAGMIVTSGADKNVNLWQYSNGDMW